MRAEDGLDFAGSVSARVNSGLMSRDQAEVALSEALRADCAACGTSYDAALAGLFGPPAEGTSASWTASSPRQRIAEFLAQHAAPVNAKKGKAQGGSRGRRKLPGEAEANDRAERALATLRAENWARRRERVVLEWHRFRGSAVARLFLTEALAALPGSPLDSRRWAELTLLALGGTRSEDYPDEEEKSLLRLRARLFEANSLRCLGDLTAANEEFALTLSIAEELDLRDLPFWAEAKNFLASLRRAQRDFPSAAREARAAAALARGAGLRKDEVQARWKLAAIFEQTGEFSTALIAIQQAVPLAREISDSVLEMGVCHSEVAILARTGQFSEAFQKYERLLPLYLQMPDRENFRLWAWSLIAAGLGRDSEAETAFRAARDGFLAVKNAYDAALVTLDWTLFLLDQNRAEEVLPLAISMGQAFEGLGVARETLASWNVFAEAAARRELTRTAAEGLVRSLGSERAAPKKPR